MPYHTKSLWDTSIVKFECRATDQSLILDGNSGEILPVDQVIKDPFHLPMSEVVADDNPDAGVEMGDDGSEVVVDEGVGVGDDEPEVETPVFADAEAELNALITAQRVDMKRDCPTEKKPRPCKRKA